MRRPSDSFGCASDPARPWLESRSSGPETVAFAWAVLTAFVRLSTHPSVFHRPFTAAQAFGLVDGWLARPPVVVVHPGNRQHHTMAELLEPLGTAGNLVPDAHLAALALRHGTKLASSDHGSARFAGLRWIDPLAS